MGLGGLQPRPLTSPPTPQPGPVAVGPLCLLPGHLPGVCHHPLLPGREGAGLCHGAGRPGHGLHRHRSQHAAGEDLPEGLRRLPPGEPQQAWGRAGRGSEERPQPSARTVTRKEQQGQVQSDHCLLGHTAVISGLGRFTSETG